MPGFAFLITEYISAPDLCKASTAACSLPPPPTASTFMPTPQSFRASIIASMPWSVFTLQGIIFLMPPVSLS